MELLKDIVDLAIELSMLPKGVLYSIAAAPLVAAVGCIGYHMHKDGVFNGTYEV